MDERATLRSKSPLLVIYLTLTLAVIVKLLSCRHKYGMKHIDS